MKLNKTREQVLDFVLESLSKEEIIWQKSWFTNKNINYVSNKPYRGVNEFLLSLVAYQKGLEDPRWLTFNQIKKEGFKLKKDSKGVPIEFWSWYDKKKKKTLTTIEYKTKVFTDPGYVKENIVPMSKIYYVFNGVDVEGIEEYKMPIYNKDSDVKDSVAYNVLHSYLDTSHIKIKSGEQAYYQVGSDSICMPVIERFTSDYDYLSVLAHEICHSTGHPTRLDRDMSGVFGDPSYALEELRAEIGSALVCGDLNLEISQEHIENHQAYIQGWHKAISDDPNCLFKAISDAQKICDFVIEVGELEKYISIEKDDFEVEMEDKVLVR